MIFYNKVSLNNAFGVGFLMCKNDSGGGLKPLYFHTGYKSELSDIVDNNYIEQGDGGGYPKILVNVLDKVILRGAVVEVEVQVIVGNTFLRGEGGVNVEKSEVESYGELYGLMARFWGYLKGMKHKENGLKLDCFKVEDLIMENDGYKTGDEVLIVEGRFKMVLKKPREWECQIKNWSIEPPIFLNGLYEPNNENPFKSYDIEFFKN